MAQSTKIGVGGGNMFGRTEDIKIECGQLDDYNVEELLKEYEPYKNRLKERMINMKSTINLEGGLKRTTVEADFKQVCVTLKTKNGDEIELILTPNEANWIANEINEVLAVNMRKVG
jgi:hypothetical protein